MILFGNINKGLEECKATPGALLVDVREVDEFKAGHIPGAVNEPLSTIDQTKLPKDKPLFLYCLRGSRSKRAEGMLKRTAKEMMTRADGHVIVDVRRQDEYDAGHIPGAILIPNETITDTKPDALQDLDQVILVYCRSGNRSKQAATKLAAMGYSNIYEFGGINTWTGEIVQSKESAAHSVTVTIDSNPTTGFSWEAVQNDTFFDIENVFIADPQTEPVSGSGGVQIFTLTPVKPGKAEVTFTYLRPWEPSDLDSQFTCAFEIAEDMRITVLEDGKAQARENGYVPEFQVI